MAIHFERRDSVTVVRTEHGKANAFDRVFLADLRAALGDARENGAGAVVLTGTGSIFSAGVDLFRLVQGGDDYARAFVPEMATAAMMVIYFGFILLVAFKRLSVLQLAPTPRRGAGEGYGRGLGG